MHKHCVPLLHIETEEEMVHLVTFTFALESSNEDKCLFFNHSTGVGLIRTELLEEEKVRLINFL